MKKNSIVFIILIIIVVLIAPYIFVEVNTYLYGGETEFLYKQTGIIGDDNYQKVLQFNKGHSKVLYITTDSISECEFEKENNEWILLKWRGIVSKNGSADGFFYPYYPMK